MKKHLVLFMAMLLCLLPATVLADTFTADVGVGKTYATIEQAVAALNGQDTIQLNIYGTVTLADGICLDADKLIIQGYENAKIIMVNAADHAEEVRTTGKKVYSNPFNPSQAPTGFSLSNDNYGDKPGSSISVKNLTIVNQKDMSLYSAGHSGRARYYAYAYAENVDYTNVVFEGGVAVNANAVFTNCAFSTDKANEFALFADYEYSDTADEYELTITNSVVTGKPGGYGGVKVANVGKSGKEPGTVKFVFINNVVKNVPATSANEGAVDTDKKVTATVTGNHFENNAGGDFKGKAGTTVNGVDATDTAAANAVVARDNPKWAPAEVSTYSAPKTGDSSNLMLWAGLMIVAAMGMVIISRKRLSADR